jgi:hypothetical protein
LLMPVGNVLYRVISLINLSPKNASFFEDRFNVITVEGVYRLFYTFLKQYA